MFPNRRNALIKNFREKLGKLEILLSLSRAYNKHKPNYNAATVLLMSNLQGKYNQWKSDPYMYVKLRSFQEGSLANKFQKQFDLYARIVNQSARSKFANQVLANPLQLKTYFKRINSMQPAPAFVITPRTPSPNSRSRSNVRNTSSRYPNSRSRSTTPNTYSRYPNSRSRSNVRSTSSSYSNSKIKAGQCTFKKLSAWGTPICK